VSGAAFVPSRTLIAALLLTLLSILMFLLLIDRTSNDLRVAHVLQVLDGQARKVFDAVYPASPSDAATAHKTARSLTGLTPVQTVSLGAVGQVVVALDRTGIADLAVKYDAVIQLVPAIGDHVRPGGTLLNVYGSRELPERRLRALLDALTADLPEERRPPLAGQGTLLDDAVASAIPRTQRAAALVPDRQGIGMSRRTQDDGN